MGSMRAMDKKKNNTHTHTHDKEAEQEEGGPSLLAKGDALFDGRRLVLLLLLLLLFGKMIVGLCGGDVVPSIEHQDGLERQRQRIRPLDRGVPSGIGSLLVGRMSSSLQAEIENLLHLGLDFAHLFKHEKERRRE